MKDDIMKMRKPLLALLDTAMNAKASGGATCKATITSINSATGAWAVEFTMK